jgi:diaminopimelate epimerase
LNLAFSKYQGTGNDFIMVNNMSGTYNHLTIKQIVLLCDRKFGIGADGLIMINKSKTVDFEMDYYNSDGSKSFCGNGARCASQFAFSLGLISSKTTFNAIDGVHVAEILDLVELQMTSVSIFENKAGVFVLDTGSPHYISFTSNLNQIDVVAEGRKIRFSDDYLENGINVNFVQVEDLNSIRVRTYERGVEDETLSCGTGVTAAVLAHAIQSNLIGEQLVVVGTLGGELEVRFNHVIGIGFESIKLIGPAIEVFKGEVNV